MTPTIGLGSKTALAGIIAAAAAFLTAAIDAGLDDTPFYSDNGVITLFVTLVGAIAAFFGGRSYQQGKLDEGTVPSDALDQAAELIDEEPTDVPAGQIAA